MNDFISIFSYFAKSNTINFLIMAAILWWIINKIDLSSMLGKSVSKIKDEIDSCEKEKSDSLALVENAQESINKLPQQIKDIEDFSKQKTEVFIRQFENSAQNSIDNINANADKVTAIEEKKISNELTCAVAQDSVEKAKNNIINMLGENPQLHNKFIKDSLKELDKVKI